MKLKTAVAIALLVFISTVGVIMLLRQFNQSNTTTIPAEQSSKKEEGQSATYTAKEVAGHNTSADCWIIIEDGVYDVTAFINSHPGGAQRIIDQCGQDASTPFETQDGHGGHSAMARSQLQSLKVGSLGVAN